jgi:transposase
MPCTAAYYERGRWLGAYDRPALFKILELYDEQIEENPDREDRPNIAAIAGEVNRSHTCVRNTISRRQRTGYASPPVNHGGQRAVKFGKDGEDALERLVLRFKDFRYALYVKYMSRWLGESVTEQSVGNALKRIGYTRKVLYKLYEECVRLPPRDSSCCRATNLANPRAL